MLSFLCNAAFSDAGEIGFALLAERDDALLVVLALAQFLVGVPFDLESDAEARIIGGAQNALDRLERKRRHAGERPDHPIENLVKACTIVGDAGDEPPDERFRRG